jgi:hypothetical protein
VIVTGHSQGGAEAVLGTAALTAAGFSVEATYTFGAPRAGSQAFANSIETPVFRLEYGHDLVPHLPASAIHGMDDVTNTLRSVFKDRGLPSIFDLMDVARKIEYVGVGDLYYGDVQHQKVLRGLSHNEEQQLFRQRLMQLPENPEAWRGHHHLMGGTDKLPTTDSNYVVLVTERAAGGWWDA